MKRKGKKKDEKKGNKRKMKRKGKKKDEKKGKKER